LRKVGELWDKPSTVPIAAEDPLWFLVFDSVSFTEALECRSLLLCDRQSRRIDALVITTICFCTCSTYSDDVHRGVAGAMPDDFEWIQFRRSVPAIPVVVPRRSVRVTERLLRDRDAQFPCDEIGKLFVFNIEPTCDQRVLFAAVDSEDKNGIRGNAHWNLSVI
jgi:hypothetical protein